jgi:protein-tyrosine phosphatase
VLTVCLGNICRSPTAAACIREAAQAAGLDVSVRSAGTGDWHVGEPPDPRMCSAAAAVGLELEGTARQLRVEDLAQADLVLAMDRDNLAAVERLARTAGLDVAVRLFRSFDERSVQSGLLEVPDPYYGGPRGFTEVVDLCRAAAAGVVAHLARQQATQREETRRA